MSKPIHLKKFIIFFIVILFILLVVLVIDYITKHVIYPRNYENIVNEAASNYNVDENLVFSIIKAESNFKENVTSNKKAKGLMQILESTALEIASKEKEFASIENLNLYNPEVNIKIGVKYISTLIDKYNGNYLFAIAAYNGGMGNVDSWINSGLININDNNSLENIPFKETKAYVKKVSKFYEMYKALYK